ncbi:MAG: hypothetical protein ACHQM6_07730, partial [Candidatus Kapaibacterium sp.]
MKYRTLHRNIFYTIVLLAFSCSSVFAQAKDSTGSKKRLREDIGIVKSLTVMPYATISFNLQSGQAFPKSAQGIGYGFGLAFDLTEDKQPVGVY